MKSLPSSIQSSQYACSKIAKCPPGSASRRHFSSGEPIGISYLSKRRLHLSSSSAGLCQSPRPWRSTPAPRWSSAWRQMARAEPTFLATYHGHPNAVVKGGLRSGDGDGRGAGISICQPLLYVVFGRKSCCFPRKPTLLSRSSHRSATVVSIATRYVVGSTFVPAGNQGGGVLLSLLIASLLSTWPGWWEGRVTCSTAG